MLSLCASRVVSGSGGVTEVTLTKDWNLAGLCMWVGGPDGPGPWPGLLRSGNGPCPRHSVLAVRVGTLTCRPDPLDQGSVVGRWPPTASPSSPLELRGPRGPSRGSPARLVSTASSPSGVRPRALAVPGTRQNIPVWASACAVPCAAVPVREAAGAPPLRSLVAAGRRCFKGDITRLRKARRVELRALGVSGAPLGSGFPPPWGHGPHMRPEDTAMAEGSELTNRLMSENADLKKQVRLVKENQMLKRLLSESCQESCGRGGRGLLMPKAPACPEACSAGSAGEPGPVSSGGSAAGAGRAPGR